MSKRATTRYPIHDLLAERWSPRAFRPERGVEVRDLLGEPEVVEELELRLVERQQRELLLEHGGSA